MKIKLLKGKVIEGEGWATLVGFPTANIDKKYLNAFSYVFGSSLVVDDISDTGKTLSSMRNKKIATLHTTSWTKVKPHWFVGLKEKKIDWVEPLMWP